MKRNPKPFSVEIKKSRVQGQRHQLPPRHLFVLTPAQITPSIQENEPPLVAQPPASPRILPSILEPTRSHSEVVEPARRKSSPRSKSDHGQMEFSLNTIGTENANDATDEDRMVPAAMWQPDTWVLQHPSTRFGLKRLSALRRRHESHGRKSRRQVCREQCPS